MSRFSDELSIFKSYSEQLVNECLKYRNQIPNANWNIIKNDGDSCIQVYFNDDYTSWAVQVNEYIEYQGFSKKFSIKDELINNINILIDINNEMGNCIYTLSNFYEKKRRNLKF